jgi:hypothetical protein
MAIAAVLAFRAPPRGDGEPSGAAAASATSPVAETDGLSGQKTELMLARAFVKALGGPEIKPARVGDGGITSEASRGARSPAAP